MTEIVFPRISAPKVSVVVVTRNGVSGHLRRTLEALLAHTEPYYELVVVDNGSTDGTVELLRSLQNTKLVLNAQNCGFGAANNQGVARARGHGLLFLNDDVFVHPGWLAPLLARLDHWPDVAVVGPKILNLDRSLQGAGALMSRSGATAMYGEGDLPDDQRYAFPRIVDYLAGACLLIRRRVFTEIGGFDPRFQPMYFEDADLCLAARAHGHLVVYEPRSVVTHVRSASGFARERPLVPLRNRHRFELRWRSLLAARPIAPLDIPRRVVAARDAPAAARLLLVANRPDTGLLLELARVCERSQLTLVTSASPPRAEQLSDAGVEIVIGEDRDAALRERRLHYDVVIAEPSSELQSLLAQTQPQAVHLDFDAVLRTARRDTRCLTRLLAEAGLVVRAP